MEIVLFIIGIVASGFISWFITDRYYRKSLGNQANEASKQMNTLIELAKSETETRKQLLMQKKIEESIEEYRLAGTPVRVIDTYTDLSNEEKADLLDLVLLRVKGRKAKNNKYRSI